MKDVVSEKAQKTFTWEDLGVFSKKQVRQGAKVVALKKGEWVLVGNTKVLLKSVNTFFGDANVVTRPNIPLLNWILLPLASLSKGQWLSWDFWDNETKVVIYVSSYHEAVLAAPHK